MTSTTTMFSVNNLEVFRRPGVVEINPRKDSYHAGCHVTFENGWVLSIQWGRGNYGDNHDALDDMGQPIGDSTTAEIAAWKGEGGAMVSWGTDEWGETVQGYCSMARVQHILDLLAEDKLMQPYQPPTPAAEQRAVDGWVDEG